MNPILRVRRAIALVAIAGSLAGAAGAVHADSTVPSEPVPTEAPTRPTSEESPPSDDVGATTTTPTADEGPEAPPDATPAESTVPPVAPPPPAPPVSTEQPEAQPTTTTTPPSKPPVTTIPSAIAAPTTTTPSEAIATVMAATAPQAPQAPVATPANAAVKLTWKAPASNGGATVDTYAVQRYTSNGWISVSFPTGLSYTVGSLTNGTKYSFRIRAHNAAGWGPISTVVSAVPRTVPAAATGLVATAGNAAVKLTWKAPASNGGATVDTYAVQRYTSNGWVNVSFPTGLSYTVGSLTNGTKYSFRIRAHNAAGWGPISTVVSAVPFTVPVKPDWCAGQQWGGAGSHWMIGKFTPPSSDGGAPVDYYRVDIWAYNNQGIFGPYTHPSEGNILHNDYKYLPYGDYLFSVAAHNAAGFGPACTAVGTLHP